MKILLFGEYSGLHTNLQIGLKEIGHKVTLISSGDGHKQFNGDIRIGNKIKNRYLNYFLNIIELWWILRKIQKYDIVQFIDYAVLKMPYILKIYYLKIIKSRNKAIIINRCGLDSYGISVLLGNLRYSPFQNALKENKFNEDIRINSNLKAIKITKIFTGIIVNMYEYYLPYKDFDNYIGFAPMPIKIEPTYVENKNNGKIKILYGVLRKSNKGHTYIKEALDFINLNYANKVEIIITGKLPFIEYQKLLDSCNILIDQACSYSYGMNAIYALAKGKVILSGNEPESENYFGIKIPIINILPDASDIIEKLIDLINNPHKLILIGKQSREYASTVHNHITVAEKFITLYNKVLHV